MSMRLTCVEMIILVLGAVLLQVIHALPQFCQLVSPAYCVGNTHTFVERGDSEIIFNSHPLPYVAVPDVGDIDGDGDIDMITCDNDGNVHFYENIGSAQLPLFQRRTGANNPFESIDGVYRCTARLVDINGDGTLDLIVGLSSAIHLYINIGTPTEPLFNTTTPSTELMPYSVYGRNFPVFVDMNADGKVDVLLGDRCETMIYYINNSTSSISFQAASILSIVDAMPPGQTVGECTPALADIDSDGDLDMLITTYVGSTYYYLNHGSATSPHFIRMHGVSNPFDGIESTSTGVVARFVDLDSDGDMDVILGANFYSQFRYLENQSPLAHPNYVVTQNEENPFYSANMRQASRPMLVRRENVSDIIVSEDFYVGRDKIFDHVLHYYKNIGTRNLPNYDDVTPSSKFAQFSTSPLPSSSIVIADMNNDKHDDLIVSSIWGLILLQYDPITVSYVWPSSSLSSFSHHFDYSRYSKPVLIDLDNDGDLDLSYGFTYYVNAGTAASPDWFSSAGVTIGSDSDTTTFADIDGDGDYDMLSSDWYGNLLYRENVGSSISYEFVRRSGVDSPFAAAENIDDYGKDARAAFGDVDNDGDVDLLVVYYGRNEFDYWENVGSSTVPEYAIHPYSSADNPFNDIVRGMPQFCDVNGDGWMDLLIGHDSGHIVYYQNINSVFTSSIGEENPFEMVYVGDRASPACGDIDNDGDIDYVVTELKNYNVYVFENIGNATSTVLVRSICDLEKPLMSNRIAPHIAGGDLNNDGLIDIVIGHDNGNLYICMHTGNATHVSYTQVPHASSPLNGYTYTRPSPNLYDIDNDGDLDIIVGDADGTLHLLKNMASEAGLSFDDSENPFLGIDVGSYASPVVFDIDNDGDSDLVVGEQSGDVTFFSNGRCSPPLGKQCTGNGACLNDRLFPSCTCFTGFTSNQCNNCQFGFYGRSCSVCPGGNDKTYLTLSNVCSQNGKCDWGYSGNGHCNCTHPFYGSTCEHGMCPRGHEKRFSNALSTFACSPCAVGFYNDNEGSTCKPCEDGKTTIKHGSTFCDYCDAGYYSEKTTQKCVACVRGMLCTSEYIPVVLEEVQLTEGIYRSRRESATLYDCPFSTCVGGNGTGDDLCAVGSRGPLCGVCKKGYYYNSVRDKCSQCGDYTTSSSIAVTVIFGFMFIVALYFLLRCVNGKSALVNRAAHIAQMFILQRLVSAEFEEDGENVISPKAQQHRSSVTILNDNFEPIPYRSPSRNFSNLVSSKPTVKSSDKEQDVETDNNNNKSASEQEEEDSFKFRTIQEKFKILLTLYQIVTSFPWTLGINYPYIYQWMLNIFSFINLDIVQIVPLGCMYESNFYTQLLLSTVTPLVICVIIYFLSLIGRMRTRTRLENGKNTKFQVESAVARSDARYFQLFLIWTFFVFPSVSTKIFRGLRSCHELDDGKSYMRDDYSIECTSSTYRNVLIVSYLMLFVYVIGIPLMYFCLLYFHRHKIMKEGTKRRVELNKIEKEELGSMDEAAKNLAISRVRWRYKWSDDIAPMGFLFMAYEPDLWWWEVLECVRRLLFTGLMVFFLPETPAQIMIGILIAVFSGLVYAKYGPYVDDGDDTVNNWSQVSIFLVLFASLALKIDITEETKQSQLIFGVLLVGVVLLTPTITLYLMLLDIAEIVSWDDIKIYAFKCCCCCVKNRKIVKVEPEKSECQNDKVANNNDKKLSVRDEVIDL